MSYGLTVRKDNKRVDFDDVFGHSIGNSGAIQIRMMDGSITILGHFDMVEVRLPEEEKEAFRRQVKEQEAMAAAEAAMRREKQQELAVPMPATEPVDEDDPDIYEEPATPEDYEALADEADEVAEEAREVASEMRNAEVKH